LKLKKKNYIQDAQYIHKNLKRNVFGEANAV